MSSTERLTNYITYIDSNPNLSRVGHYDHDTATIQPLSFTSGTYISNLYQVIEAGEDNICQTTERPFPSTVVKILPPLAERDVLCVGKNYLEHAKEFNSSGFDSSDTVDRPSRPVIFTKRFTSIIAHGEEIYSHPDFTQTADYEGEIGVIIGKPCFRVPEADAMDYVWGYTIVNDMTARERQRDHKQFYIGKSADTFCPMGPVAVPKQHVDRVLKVQTRVNGELRQDATTEDLIFSIPFLLKTMSEGQTLLPGDILATGTPAGVGIGLTPPIYLRPGDEISISVQGLGTLTNRIASVEATNPTLTKFLKTSRFPSLPTNTTSPVPFVNNKPANHQLSGSRHKPPLICIHGLGLTLEYFDPLIYALQLDNSWEVLVYDLEGHGGTPTTPLSRVSIESLANDLAALIEHLGLEDKKWAGDITIITQGMGCLVALWYNHIISEQRRESMTASSSYLPSPKLAKIILLHPPPHPLPDHEKIELQKRAHTARTQGMRAIETKYTPHVSNETVQENPHAILALKYCLRATDVEGYAKACTALAEAPSMHDLKTELENVQVLIITGQHDRLATPNQCKKLAIEQLGGNAGLEVLPNVGAYCVLEDTQGLKGAIGGFLDA